MSEPAPGGTFCATHFETSAAWTCRRCGAFYCRECERRTRPEALPMCPACWELRAEKVTAPEKTNPLRLRVVGLVLGVLALVPGCFLLQLAAIVVNIVAISSGRKKQVPREALSIVGLLLSLLGLLISLGVLFFAGV